MSCRVFKKDVELFTFNKILDVIASKDIKTIKAEYIKTNKNAIVEEFYDKLGFNLTDKTADKRLYKMSLSNISSQKKKNYIKDL